MIALGFSTSSPRCSVAIADEDRVFGEIVLGDPRGALEGLLDSVEKLVESAPALASSAGKLDAVDAIAVDIGPGSLTGARIGVMIAKTLAFQLKKPLAGVSAFDLYLDQYVGGADCVWVAISSTRSEMLLKGSRRRPAGGWEPIGKEMDIADADLGSVAWPEAPFALIGPAARRAADRLEAAGLTGRVAEALDKGEITAAATAQAGIRRLKTGIGDDPLTLTPNYVCLANAEKSFAGRAADKTK